jgi:hypothetical protein
VRVAPQVAAEAALRARTAERLGQARLGEREFEAAFGPARTAVRGAGAQGSEGWVAAQQAISRAEAARAPTTGALAELDRLVVERADRPTNVEDFAALRGALEAAAALAAGQQERLDRLRASIRR